MSRTVYKVFSHINDILTLNTLVHLNTYVIAYLQPSFRSQHVWLGALVMKTNVWRVRDCTCTHICYITLLSFNNKFYKSQALYALQNAQQHTYTLMCYYVHTCTVTLNFIYKMLPHETVHVQIGRYLFFDQKKVYTNQFFYLFQIRLHKFPKKRLNLISFANFLSYNFLYFY